MVLRPILLAGKPAVITAHTDFSGFSPAYLAGSRRGDRAGPHLPGRPRAGSGSRYS